MPHKIIGATQQDECVTTGRGHVLFYDLLGKVTDTTLPLLGLYGTVDGVEDPKPVWKSLRHFVDQASQENMLFCAIAKNERQPCFVVGEFVQGVSDHLEHGGETSPSGNHADFLPFVRLVFQLVVNVSEFELVSGMESKDMICHSTVWFAFHNDVEEALGVVWCHWCIEPLRLIGAIWARLKLSLERAAWPHIKLSLWIVEEESKKGDI